MEAFIVIGGFLVGVLIYEKHQIFMKNKTILIILLILITIILWNISSEYFYLKIRKIDWTAISGLAAASVIVFVAIQTKATKDTVKSYIRPIIETGMIFNILDWKFCFRFSKIIPTPTFLWVEIEIESEKDKYKEKIQLWRANDPNDDRPFRIMLNYLNAGPYDLFKNFREFLIKNGEGYKDDELIKKHIEKNIKARVNIRSYPLFIKKQPKFKDSEFLDSKEYEFNRNTEQNNKLEWIEKSWGIEDPIITDRRFF